MARVAGPPDLHLPWPTGSPIIQSSPLMSQPTIESILQENRLFQPLAEFAQAAHINSWEAYEQLYAQAQADPASFWAGLAERELHWFEPWQQVLDWHPPMSSGLSGAKSTLPTTASIAT